MVLINSYQPLGILEVMLLEGEVSVKRGNKLLVN